MTATPHSTDPSGTVPTSADPSDPDLAPYTSDAHGTALHRPPGAPRPAPEEDVVDDLELGATTAEYGIVMLAAVGFAGLLVVILKSGEVKELLMGIIRTALSTG